MAARREHKRYRDEEPTAAESSEAVIDFGATPMWHPPASYQQESSVRQALGPDEALKDNSTASISSSTQDHGDSVAAKSILHLHSLSFEALETPYRKDPATTTPVNRRDAVHRVMATDSEVFAQRYQRRMLDFNIDMYDIDETQIASVDKDDGRMYHIGHKGGDTFSGTFATDRPLPREAQAMVDQMLDKPNIEARKHSGAEVEQHIRSLLSTGSSLILERTPNYVSNHVQIHCGLPGCLSRTDCVPPATYFFAFRHLGISDQHDLQDFCFCLACTEWLWKGDFPREDRQPGIMTSMDSIAPSNIMDGPQASPQSTPRMALNESDIYCGESNQSGSTVSDFWIPQLDGPAGSMRCINEALDPEESSGSPRDLREVSSDYVFTPGCLHPSERYDSPRFTDYADPENKPKNSIQDSRHASHSPQLQVPTPGYTHYESDDEDITPTVSPQSTDSEGSWYYPPTRFQHIANFVKPGLSLSKKEKAAVWLWKAASKSQLRWDRHVQYARRLREQSSGVGEFKQPEEQHREMEDQDYEEEEVVHWEHITGIRKKDCHGNDLSEVLNKVAKTADV